MAPAHHLICTVGTSLVGNLKKKYGNEVVVQQELRSRALDQLKDLAMNHRDAGAELIPSATASWRQGTTEPLRGQGS